MLLESSSLFSLLLQIVTAITEFWPESIVDKKLLSKFARREKRLSLLLGARFKMTASCIIGRQLLGSNVDGQTNINSGSYRNS